LTPDQAQALVALPSSALIEAAGHLSRHGSLRTRTWLDQRYPRDLSLAILDCVATRAHFSAKFESVTRWLLSKEAAEQATASRIAQWRADYLRSRFPTEQTLVELGTGLGGDSAYLARRFTLAGYEQDPARAILARANIRELGGEACSFTVQARQISPQDLPDGLVFADPSRRGRSRCFDPESWSPPLSHLLSLNRPMVLKTAPGLSLDLLPRGVEAHFISIAGELKEAMLLHPLSPEDGSERHAWLFLPGAEPPLHLWGQPRSVPIAEPRPGHYLHEPDPCLLRSGLLDQLARPLQAGVVHPKIAYLSGPSACPNAWATSFRILEAQGLNWKGLERALLETDWSEVEYLSRGVPFSQEEFLARTRQARKRMKGRPGGRGAVILYRLDRGYHAVLARRAQPMDRE
jgi:hypothetical protein